MNTMLILPQIIFIIKMQFKLFETSEICWKLVVSSNESKKYGLFFIQCEWIKKNYVKNPVYRKILLKEKKRN